MLVKRFWLFTLTATACYSDVLTPEKMRADYARLVPSPKADVHAFYQLAHAYTQEMEKAPWGTPQACNYRDTLYAMFTQGHGWWGGFSKTTVANTQEKHVGLTALLALSARTPKAQVDAVQAQIQREAPGSLVRGHYSLVHEVLSAGWTVLNESLTARYSSSIQTIFTHCDQPNLSNWHKKQLSYAVGRFMRPGMQTELGLLNPLENVPGDQWDDILDKAGLFISGDMGEMDLYSVMGTVASLKDIPPTTWGSLVPRVQRLLAGLTGRGGGILVGSLKGVPTHHLNFLLDTAVPFIHEGMRWTQRHDVLKGLMAAPPEQLEEIAPKLPRLLEGLDAEHRSELLKWLQWVPSEKYKEIVDKTLLFITPTTRYDDRYRLFDLVKYAPSDLWPLIEPLFALLTPEVPTALRRDLFNRMKIIPAGERAARVQRVLHHIDVPADHERYGRRILEILETPLNRPIPPLAGGMAAAAAGAGGYTHGINVHNGSRDAKTTQAYRLLKAAQTGLTPQTIGDAYSDFSKVLDTQGEPLKSRIKIALGLQEPGTWGFGPLLAGTITSCDLNMSGEELIGRLWHFVNTYREAGATSASQESAEQENARQSVFAGLSSALEDDGHVVCNPGKLQRLAVSVLQGRLQGVNIDDVPLERASSGGASAAASSAKVPTPTETTELVQGAWERYKESHTGGPLTHADVEAFGRQFIADNPHYHKGAFEGVMEYLRAHETDE